MWAVKIPPGFLACLPKLAFLDYRGGSGSDLSFLNGCSGLRGLDVNQVRGMDDLSVLASLVSLRQLDLYGLPRVAHIPSLSGLEKLRRAWVGSMKGLEGLTGLLDAQALEELVLLKAVGLDDHDAERISAHPNIAAFDWVAEDVPDRIWVPFCERVAKPKPSMMRSEVWFRAHASD
ncbi:MAG: hypothetical protein JWQ11_1170 [Rhizobacter sp.]|nr:hypothetical protein [Rhizobacter sp.]